jgi:hypothetical protein
MRASNGVQDKKLVETILLAVKTGYTHFDGAEGMLCPLYFVLKHTDHILNYSLRQRSRTW